MVGSCPCPQKLDQAGKVYQGQTLQLIMTFVNYVRKKFYKNDTWTM